ncbi:MAG: sugar ABC transporter permease [Treponema sp.]|nr:sugar ABC transporter permease [Treponema sp.]
MKQKRIGFETQNRISGFLYFLPWLLGFIMFFLSPLVTTVWYSLNQVRVAAEGGTEFVFLGLGNYIDLFTSEVSANAQPFSRLFVDENILIFTQLPLITIFSLFLAILANAKYPGRGIVRVIFFLPIVFGLELVRSYGINSAGRSLIEAAAARYYENNPVIMLLWNYTFLPLRLIRFLSSAMEGIFTLFTRTGVQTMIFLAGLQSISPAHYEVAKIEGANAYTIFWRVTLPSISHVMMFVIIYTLIDLFMGSIFGNEIYQYAYSRGKIGMGSALSVVYILNVILALGVVWVFMRRAKIIDR